MPKNLGDKLEKEKRDWSEWKLRPYEGWRLLSQALIILSVTGVVFSTAYFRGVCGNIPLSEHFKKPAQVNIYEPNDSNYLRINEKTSEGY